MSWIVLEGTDDGPFTQPAWSWSCWRKSGLTSGLSVDLPTGAGLTAEQKRDAGKESLLLPRAGSGSSLLPLLGLLRRLLGRLLLGDLLGGLLRALLYSHGSPSRLIG